ncbi:MAG: DNA polymerase-3 subunit epsilon [Paracoccaceae bacterium]|jgi:DNA polymerase-3 subunit epsilon
MREIVLDTETTGFEPASGDRIVEIGAIELINHMPTGQTYHQYINPERPMPKAAYDVHGLGDDFLRDKPVFAKIAEDFLAFIANAPLVIHNASFDMKFLNAELVGIGLPALPMSRSIDTVHMARKKFPGSPASLDALCRRFGVDNASRQKHGALLDSEILAEVYLELIGGRQPDLVLASAQKMPEGSQASQEDWRPHTRPKPLPPLLSNGEHEAHKAFVAQMGVVAIWTKFAQN